MEGFSMKINFRFVLAALLCLCMTTAAFAKETVRIGTEGAYPPFNWVEPNGDLKGFDIDIAKALMEKMGTEGTFEIQDWDGLIPALLAKKFDCIVASMSINEERKKKVDFTVKYYQTPAMFVAAKGSNYSFTADGLSGKIIGVQGATIHEHFLQDNFKGVEVKPYKTLDEACADMVTGRLDLVLGDSVAFVPFLKSDEGKAYELTGPAYTDPKYFGEGIGIAVRKGDTKLREALNKAIKAIRADGTYQKINTKYFDFDIYGN